MEGESQLALLISVYFVCWSSSLFMKARTQTIGDTIRAELRNLAHLHGTRYGVAYTFYFFRCREVFHTTFLNEITTNHCGEGMSFYSDRQR